MKHTHIWVNVKTYFYINIRFVFKTEPVNTDEKYIYPVAAELIYGDLGHCEGHVWETEMFHKPNHVTLRGNSCVMDGMKKNLAGVRVAVVHAVEHVA